MYRSAVKVVDLSFAMRHKSSTFRKGADIVDAVCPRAMRIWMKKLAVLKQ